MLCVDVDSKEVAAKIPNMYEGLAVEVRLVRHVRFAKRD
jgi:hypothetical protein